MAHLDELVIPVRQLSRDEFAQTYPHPFLLWLHEAREDTPEWSFKTQTSSQARAELARLIDEGLELAPEVSHYEVFRVTKTQNNPWRDRISVGRARNNDIVLLDNSVSKLHAHFSGEGEAVTVGDAGSRNGTRVNQASVPGGLVQSLKSGDTVTFGRVDTLFLDAAGLFDFLSRRISRRS